jgi:hypothetical protein
LGVKRVLDDLAARGVEETRRLAVGGSGPVVLRVLRVLRELVRGVGKGPLIVVGNISMGGMGSDGRGRRRRRRNGDSTGWVGGMDSDGRGTRRRRPNGDSTGSADSGADG